jgi:hypothetical protein
MGKEELRSIASKNFAKRLASLLDSHNIWVRCGIVPALEPKIVGELARKRVTGILSDLADENTVE